MIVRDVFAHRHHLPSMRQSATLRTAVGLTLVATPLALGGGHPEVNAILAGMMVILLTVALWRRRG